MTVANKHGLYAVSLADDVLAGVRRQNLVLGNEVRAEAASGEIYARFAALYAQKQSPGFSTLAVADALGLCGLLGVNLPSLTGPPAGLILYAQKHALGAARASGSVHRSYAFTNGILAPRRLEIPHRGNASLDYECVAISPDGTNAPLTLTDDVALPPIDADVKRHTLGPVTLGGIAMTGFRQVSVDLGTDLVGESADSDLWDTFASIREQNTTITLRGINTQWLKTTNIPITGLACTHANTKIYLRKRALGSTFVAPATAEHIKLTAAGMAVVEDAFNADGSAAAECSIVLTCYYDGTNAPLIALLDQAIT